MEVDVVSPRRHNPPPSTEQGQPLHRPSSVPIGAQQRSTATTVRRRFAPHAINPFARLALPLVPLVFGPVKRPFLTRRRRQVPDVLHIRTVQQFRPKTKQSSSPPHVHRGTGFFHGHRNKVSALESIPVHSQQSRFAHEGLLGPGRESLPPSNADRSSWESTTEQSACKREEESPCSRVPPNTRLVLLERDLRRYFSRLGTRAANLERPSLARY